MEISLRARYGANRRSSLTLYTRPMSVFKVVPSSNANTRSAAIPKISTLPSSLPKVMINLNAPQIPSLSSIASVSSDDIASPTDGTNTPISDVGLPNVIRLNTSRIVCANGACLMHKDLVLEDCALLPAKVDESFSNLFQKKMRICNSICDFSIGANDRDAKTIKTATLNELIIVYSDLKLAKTIPLWCNKDLLEMIKTNIVREIPKIPALYLNGDDEPRIEEPSMPHLISVYTLLQKLLIAVPSKDIFNDKFLKILLNLFSLPDFNERDLLSATLLNYFTAFPDRQEVILKSIGMLLGEYQSGGSSQFIVWPCLSFLCRVFKYTTPNIPTQFFKIFSYFVVPLLSSPRFVSFYPQFKLLMECVISVHSRFAAPLLRNIMARWPTTRPGKQIPFIEMINNVSAKLSLSEFQQVVKPLFILYAKCASGSAKVAEISFQIWSKRDMIPLILENAKTIFPIVQPSFISCSREYWNSTIQNKALAVLKAMHDIDPFLYEEISQRAKLSSSAAVTQQQNSMMNSPNSYSAYSPYVAAATSSSSSLWSQSYGGGEEGPLIIAAGGGAKQQKTWATVARAAARTDRDVNLGQVLANIQLAFNGPFQAMASVSSSGGQKSSPKICHPMKKEVPVWR